MGWSNPTHNIDFSVIFRRLCLLLFSAFMARFRQCPLQPDSMTCFVHCFLQCFRQDLPFLWTKSSHSHRFYCARCDDFLAFFNKNLVAIVLPAMCHLDVVFMRHCTVSSTRCTSKFQITKSGFFAVWMEKGFLQPLNLQLPSTGIHFEIPLLSSYLELCLLVI